MRKVFKERDEIEQRYRRYKELERLKQIKVETYEEFIQRGGCPTIFIKTWSPSPANTVRFRRKASHNE